MNSNFPTVFYIYTPRWTSSSAGIKALHFLCHSLNIAGFESFLVLSDSPSKKPSVSEDLITPVLTSEVSKLHLSSGRKMIAVYSETVPGNPLNAKNVIRYLMNYAGALGGQKVFRDSEYIIYYSNNIARDYEKKKSKEFESRVLFLPTVDPKELKNNINEREDFYLLYAGKYRAFVGPPPIFADREIIEIKRHGRNAHSREDLIDLLSRCRAVISMENSSIITEAVLSGAPGLFYPNDFLREAIAEKELGWGGTGWGISGAEENKARSSLKEGYDAYIKQVEQFPVRLLEVFSTANEYFDSEAQKQALKIPRSYAILSVHRFRMSFQIISILGFSTWLKVVKNFLLRRISGRF